MAAIRRVSLAAAAVVAAVTAANAQVIGTFSWQTQPYCNVVTVTVVQQGGMYQLAGNDALCGAGAAPVTGTAIPTGTGVAFGFVAALPSGRAAHISASITLGTLSGTWTDADGNTGPFVFGAATAGAPRPAPLPATAITVNQFSPSVYGGTGSAATVSRSDHDHDTRYYTKPTSDALFVEDAQLLSAVVGTAGNLFRGAHAVSSARLGTGVYEVIFDRDVRACTYVAVSGHDTIGSISNRILNVAQRGGNANGVFMEVRSNAGALADAGFHVAVVCP